MSSNQDPASGKAQRLLATVSAHVILVDRNENPGGPRILLGRLAYRDHRWGKWSFPGGYMDHGEEPEAALCREVREETGMQLLSWERIQVQPMLHLEHPHISFLYSSDHWQGNPVCLTREFLDLQWADESVYRQWVREEALAYPCMRDQVSFLGWVF
ncbi:MAG: NUDIX domain-containing protein [Magnetococcales bacterium]|nr:NUDIX domain-containing protein [Magnetococcales bacterium]MBF0151175.1 NUDIX domain-containing protein [Magnetococcales bacterium]MBF0174625.1 NUDIX domain-containing protein [Magnetococcales bacterium]MBF0632657.1 NUDIX domain-containing protein [Magnetococcales bacterium]